MRKFIISAVVAVVAAVSFAAPSQAGYYGYGHKSYGYGHKSYGYKHYGYKRHFKRHYGGNYGVKIIIKKNHYSYY